MLPKIKNYFHQVIEAEVLALSAFYNKCWILPLGEEDPLFRDSQKFPLRDFNKINDCELILMDGNLNYHYNVQALLEELKPHLKRHNRLSVVIYNSYFKFFYQLANILQLRSGPAPKVFFTKLNLENLCRLAGYELTLLKPTVFFPFYIPLVSNLINKIIPTLPGLGSFSFAHVAVLRPILPETQFPSISIIIPARNEKDNIRNALKQIPDFKTKDIEIIFVEGNSTDNTWEEIQQQIKDYTGELKLSAYKQSGKGKKDAVEVGFEKAQGDLLTILDADLTMPPENLIQFYNAYIQGQSDFINGNRLFYPMENEAMRPLNLIGNIFFAKALSFVLRTGLSDSLCGTKLFSRKHYQMMKNWNKHFGKFDPFGDFEMIFPACVLGFGVLDIPIRYKNRTYGTTNISRFRDGLQLLKMVLVGFFKIKLGKTP